MRSLLSVLLVAVVACGPAESGLLEPAVETASATEAVTGAEVSATAEAFLAALPAAWSRTRGEWRLTDVAECMKPGGFCFGNNPSSPYGYPAFGPGDIGASAFQWDRDEAVVIFLRTPPRVRYFAFTQYLFQVAGAPRPAFASLSDSLNLSQFGTAGSRNPGENVFGQQAVVVWTANLNTLASVQAVLATMGVPASAVNVVPMPSQIPGFAPSQGYGPASDTFTMLMRIALPESQRELDAYLAEKPLAVVKVGPGSPIAFAPAPVIGYAEETTGVSETTMSPDLQRALNALSLDIRSRYDGVFSFSRETVSHKDKTGWDCLTGQGMCAGDNHDAFYTGDGSVVRVSSLRDAVLIVGVNHVRTGKATYINHSVYELEHLAGVAAVSDRLLTPESALYHAGVTPQQTLKASLYRDLYAYLISFDCAGLSYCLQIPQPTPGNPVGIPAGAPFVVAGRAYLEPRSHVRPDAAELVLHQVWSGRRP